MEIFPVNLVHGMMLLMSTGIGEERGIVIMGITTYSTDNDRKIEFMTILRGTIVLDMEIHISYAHENATEMI